MGIHHRGNMNLKELAKDLEMEEEEFLEIVNLFLETASVDLDKLQSALDEWNGPMAAKTAHSIKGAAATLGLMEIYEVAKRIEVEAHENHFEKAKEGVRAIREKLEWIYENLERGSSNVKAQSPN